MEDFFNENWVFLVPIVLVDLVLKITSVVHVCRHDRYRFGNKIVWIFVCLLINIFGPVIYFAVGKGEE